MHELDIVKVIMDTNNVDHKIYKGARMGAMLCDVIVTDTHNYYFESNTGEYLFNYEIKSAV